MAVIEVINQKAEKVSEAELPDDIFNVAVKSSVLHEVVRMQMAGRRSGTARVKRRGDIRGSGKKLFRQKGTGRARRGNIKSPLLRGGGVTFGPSQRDFSYTVPKKVKRLALKMALSDKLNDKRLLVLDRLEMEEIKTRDFVKILDTLEVSNALFITAEDDEKIMLSSRNVPGVKIMRKEGLNVYDILRYDHLILLEPSLQDIGRRLRAS
ncbi:MAG: 50S ribosomal protein L4 [Desulfobacterales bacterium]|nr:50S ribosomal protein L4 [Desulfobacterales bacterium]